MKKSNVILTVVALVASAVLLWLWYYLGFNNVDSPLDLVMSVIWWVIVVAGVALVAKAEGTRRQTVRTAYVGDGRLYNSESGLLTLGAGASATDSVAAVLAGLDYGFARSSRSSGATSFARRSTSPRATTKASVAARPGRARSWSLRPATRCPSRPVRSLPASSGS